MSVLSILMPLTMLLVVGLLLASLAYVLVRARQPGFSFSPTVLLSAYFRLVTMISIVVLIAGAAALLNIGFASVLGRDFAFYSPPVYGPAVEQQQARNAVTQENLFRQGLVEGITMVVLGLILLGSHTLAQRVFGAGSSRDAFVERAYLMVLLIVLSGVGIISLAVGLSQAAWWFVYVPPVDPVVGEQTFRTAPGGVLALALTLLPLWIWFLVRFARAVRRPDPA
jgi:hypothetical protein